MKEHDLHSGA